MSRLTRIGLVILATSVISGWGFPASGSQAATSAAPLNVGGTFVWQTSDANITGRFTGSLVLFPRIAQVPCATAAGANTSSPQGANTPGRLAPHPGLITPFPFSAPGPGKPLAAFIDLVDYHGPGTYTNSSFAHQTYAYPAGSDVQTSPVEAPGAEWSMTMDANGSGHLTYSGPSQHTGPLGPTTQIELSMTWTCDDAATPAGVGGVATTRPAARAAPPAHTAKSSGLNGWLIAVPVIAVLAALVALLLALRSRRARRAPCHCQVTLSITGPSQIGVRECARPAHWTVKGANLSALLAGDGLEERNLSALPVIECSGGGSAEITEAAWSVALTHLDQLTVTCVLRVLVHCADGETTETQQSAELPISLVPHPCCGPDITELFMKCVNRSMDRLRRDPPLSATYFMARWGVAMICRPFKLGVFIPGGCPSRQECSDTVTVCGRCLDCYVPDNFLFGVIAGWVDVPLAEMEVMGWTAKLVKTKAQVVPGHVISEELWRAGFAFGRAAHENARAGRPYHLDRATLERELRVALSRDDCGPCDKPASGLRLDFSEEPW